MIFIVAFKIIITYNVTEHAISKVRSHWPQIFKLYPHRASVSATAAAADNVSL